MSGLWNKDRPSDAAAKAAQHAATLERMRKGLMVLPGTWLQLSPDAATAKTPSVPSSAVESPPLDAKNAGPIAAEMSFLSNHAPASRSSSVSSEASVSTKPATFKPVPTVCERETIGLARFRAD